MQTDSLSTQLTSSAARLAQSALTEAPAGNHAVFTLHAGAALEHLAKAVLVRRHPALIAAQDFDSLLHACAQDAAIPPGARFKTITAREALHRAKRFVPPLGNLMPQLEVLLEARNDVAHLGQAMPAGVHLPSFLKSAELLRASLDLDRDAFWGPFTGSVDAALDKAAKEARVVVETALAAARSEFDRRYAHLTDDAREAVFSAIEANYRLAKYEDAIVDCPACGHAARLAGTCDAHWEQDDEFSASLLADLLPGYLHCNVCDLELDGDDQLEAAGLDQPVPIDDVDPADFYEPEWDDYR